MAEIKKEKRLSKMNELEYFKTKAKKQTQLNKDIIELMATIGYGTIAPLLNNIIDEGNASPAVINAAKYCNYYVEKHNTIDEPTLTQYNDYKEGVE